MTTLEYFQSVGLFSDVIAILHSDTSIKDKVASLLLTSTVASPSMMPIPSGFRAFKFGSVLSVFKMESEPNQEYMVLELSDLLSLPVKGLDYE